MNTSITISIGLPCGVHSEVRGDPSRCVQRNNDNKCTHSWCLMNSGEWEWYPETRWIVNRMKELGWKKGVAFGTFWDQAANELKSLQPHEF